MKKRIIQIFAVFAIFCSLLSVRVFAASGLTYRTHVQDIGWINAVSEKQTSGTTGRSLRVEALEVYLPSHLSSFGDIRIQAHVQDIGWMNEVKQGQAAGTSGLSKRMEAVKIRLTGELAERYSVYYRTHVQDIGWQSWVKDGEIAGTTGRSLRVEAIQIYLEEKEYVSKSDVGITYQAHSQDIGWMNPVSSGQIAGTTGQSKRMEALRLTLNSDLLKKGNVSVSAHVANVGWMAGVPSGQIAGTTGKGNQLEGLKMTLTGNLANDYDIYYRAHVEDFGWLGWGKNGVLAGSEGCNRRIEAVQIAVYQKGDANAPQTSTSYTTVVKVVKPDILVVNKKHGLSPNYAPGEDPTAGNAIRTLIRTMRNAGYSVSTSYSGYRSYSYQASLYNYYVQKDGQAAADRYSARPGYSEHQTGLAFDLMSPSGALLTTTREVNWVAAHAHEYGFIVRYQDGKEHITGYMAEPWHLRYVGKYATEIYKSGLTLEEYLGVEGGTKYN